MKKLFLAVLALSFALSACNQAASPSSNTDNPPPPTSPEIPILKAVKTTGVRSLYTSKVKASGGAWRAAVAPDAEISTLAYIGPAGETAPVVFTASDSRDVILGVSKTRAAGDSWIIADFNALYTADGSEQIPRSGRALADMRTGSLYDFSAYAIDDAFIDGGTVYARGAAGTTLYKVALGSGMQGVPLNNAAYNPVERIKLKIGDGIVCWSDTGGNKIFSISGAFTPKDAYLGEGTFYKYITDGSGDMWMCHVDTYRDDPPNFYDYYERVKVTLSSSGEIEYEPAAETIYLGPDFIWIGHGGEEIAISPTEYVWYSSLCFYHIYKDQAGIHFSHGKFMEDGDVQRPYGKTFYRDGCLYWLSGTSIYRIALADGASETAIYSNPNILPTIPGGQALSLSGDTLFFYAYADATTVNTYSIPVDGPYTPELLSTSRAEIRDIVELAF